MPVATGTMEDENGVGHLARAWQMAGTWIPAYAGMTVGVVVKGGFQTRPCECWLAGGYFQRNPSCSLAVCTPRDENGR